MCEQWGAMSADAFDDGRATPASASTGQPNPADEILTRLYDELRALAAEHLRRERPDHTLQATALVHEAYLRLASQRSVPVDNPAHFLALASMAIRRVLVDHARQRNRAKRRRNEHVLRELLQQQESSAAQELDTDFEAIDTALFKLAEFDQRKAKVVELRYFGGLSIAEAADVLEISSATVERDWAMARAWLHRELSADGVGE